MLQCFRKSNYNATQPHRHRSEVDLAKRKTAFNRNESDEQLPIQKQQYQNTKPKNVGAKAKRRMAVCLIENVPGIANHGTCTKRLHQTCCSMNIDHLLLLFFAVPKVSSLLCVKPTIFHYIGINKLTTILKNKMKLNLGTVSHEQSYDKLESTGAANEQ